MSLRIDPVRFKAWASLCAAALGEARHEIDALNVFPVADSDTGTNSFLTFSAGETALDADCDGQGVADLLKTYGDALLVGAKGNSGVILAELVRGSLRVLRQCHEGVEASDVARALAQASQAAHEAVGEPAVGTILTVAAAAAAAADQSANDGAGPKETLEQAAQAARTALALTPTQMPLLAQAGVVDAGGRALVVVLDATVQALTGRVPPTSTATAAAREVVAEHIEATGPAYEVMFLLKADDELIADFRRKLMELGDSVVVIGGEGLWNVHVHVDDIGAAIEAGIDIGRPFHISVTHFATAAQRKAPRSTERTVITAVTGEGLSEVAREAGAQPLEFSITKPLSVEQMVQAIEEAHCDEIIVLPNSRHHITQFEAAARVARDKGVRVAVIPTIAQAQALAALAVHEPRAGFDEVVVAMTSAAQAVRHGAVTVAAHDGMTMAGRCQIGDVLGVVDGDFAVIGSDINQIALQVFDQLEAPRAEILTVVAGSETSPDLFDELLAALEASYPLAEVMSYRGNQPRYQYFLAAE